MVDRHEYPGYVRVVFVQFRAVFHFYDARCLTDRKCQTVQINRLNGPVDHIWNALYYENNRRIALNKRRFLFEILNKVIFGLIEEKKGDDPAIARRQRHDYH